MKAGDTDRGLVREPAVETRMTIIEEPGYELSLREGDFEIRDYGPLVAAEVVVSGERSRAANDGFRILAHYIFGGNKGRKQIAMTAPVVQSLGKDTLLLPTSVTRTSADDPGGKGQWLVRFTMPHAYTLDTLPTPNDPKIRLVAVPPARYVVIRFSGLARDPQIAEKTSALDEFVSRRHLAVTGPASLARYDPPWTLWFMRRNEVMLPLAPRHAP